MSARATLPSALLLAWLAATQAAGAGAPDPRIRDVPYDPDAVVAIAGHVGYATTVFFHPEETVQSVAIGDDAWHVAPELNRISIKPRGDDPWPGVRPAASESDTNMTVWTDRRVYFFELRAVRPPAAETRTFALRFRYPPGPDRAGAEAARRREAAGRAALRTGAANAVPRSAGLATVPRQGARNWNYSWSGHAALRPAAAFDDGQFTYLQFPAGVPLPAVYVGEEDGGESIANLHVRGEWVVIHRVASKLVLRDGRLVACVFRETGGRS